MQVRKNSGYISSGLTFSLMCCPSGTEIYGSRAQRVKSGVGDKFRSHCHRYLKPQEKMKQLMQEYKVRAMKALKTSNKQ